MPVAAPAGLAVRELGVVPYDEARALMTGLVDGRAAGRIPDTLLLLEHPHTITAGRGFNGHTVKTPPHPVHHIERGGDVTYHGPGQLVGYPIVHLKERGLTVGAYLRLLEDALIEAVGALGLEAERVKGFTGVWSRGKKIASIGVAVRAWTTYHGFALNVDPDLSQFRSIYPCGLEPERMASLASLLGRAPAASRVRAAVASALARRLV